MKRKFNLRGKVPMSLLVLSLVLFSQCQKDLPTEAAAPVVKMVSADKISAISTSATTLPTTVNSADFRPESGYAFKLKRDFGVAGDDLSNGSASSLRLFENGVELGPAHSVHSEIINYGRGRFSHWGNVLYFSTSDNSDPRSNGRKYTYTTASSSTTTTDQNSTSGNVVFDEPAETPAANGPIGYAAVNWVTTGGAAGSTVTVNTLSALRGYASSSLPLTIQVSGTISGTGSVLVKSNKTIIGLSGATLNGVGLRIFGNSATDVTKNIIIKNLRIKNVIQIDPVTGNGDNDCIGIKYADHIWIDHCELSADVTHPDWEYYDGLIDISKQSDFITVSWCKLVNSWKGSFVGGTSDSGKNKLHITFHHNLFNNIAERGPALIYSTVHLFNNYYLKSATSSGYSIGARYSSKVLLENNYFEGISTPVRTDIDSEQGYVSGTSTNIFKSCGALRIKTSDPGLTVPYAYKSYLIPAANVPATVLAGAGVK